MVDFTRRDIANITLNIVRLTSFTIIRTLAKPPPSNNAPYCLENQAFHDKKITTKLNLRTAYLPTQKPRYSPKLAQYFQQKSF